MQAVYEGVTDFFEKIQNPWQERFYLTRRGVDRFLKGKNSRYDSEDSELQIFLGILYYSDHTLTRREIRKESYLDKISINFCINFSKFARYIRSTQGKRNLKVRPC